MYLAYKISVKCSQNLMEQGCLLYTSSQIMQPIISAGDTVGSVLLLGKNERDVMGESEKMLIRTASGFLGRQMAVSYTHLDVYKRQGTYYQ